MRRARIVIAGLLVAVVTLTVPTLCGAQGYTLSMQSVSADGGSPFALPLLGEWAAPIEGFTLSIAFPPLPPLEGLDVSVANTLVGAENPEFVSANVFPAAGEAVLGVLFDALPPFDGQTMGPLGFPTALAEVVGTVAADASDQTIPFDYVDGLGSPPVNNIYVVASLGVPPDTMSGGTLTIHSTVPPVPLFVRGDIHQNGMLDISDVITLLTYIFVGGAVPECKDAADTNDDGIMDIADGIWILVYLFNGGPQPFAPFPAPGPDPTPDELDCQVSIY